ncbi:hypothetical protein [Capnocytophaga gingivalis]|uniref:hypothetical protein n=1 Tax=Capnocytophaga gingivalis TaxID=1017 RepID=UPI003C76ED88
MISINKSFNLQEKFADEQIKNLRYFEDITDEEIKDFVKEELFYLGFLESIEEAESIYKSEDEDIIVSVDDTPVYYDTCSLPCRDERMLIPCQDGKMEKCEIFRRISVEVYGVGMLGCSNDFYIIKIVRQ